MEVTHPVPQIDQSQEMSCWAASAAMMLSFHGEPTTEQQVLDRFPDFGTDGADVGECLRLSTELGMQQLPEMCRPAESWWEMVSAGPVMVGIPGHFIVVAGMAHDEGSDSYMFLVNDPARGQAWQDYLKIETLYEDDAFYGYDLMGW